jgi:anaerobic ribonucleoside-triphosphate reductase
MIKFLICLFGVHRWKLIERKSYPPTATATKIWGEIEFTAKCVILGYAKTISVCEYCGKRKEEIDLGR